MGKRVSHTQFSAKDVARFRQQLNTDLEALEALLERPKFGLGPATLGFELELSLVDPDGKPCWINALLERQAADPQLTLELNQYNLEYNLMPVAAKGAPFSSMAEEMQTKLKTIGELARTQQALPVTIGILPTVRTKDISRAATTNDARYHALAEQVCHMRGKPFEIAINGKDPLFAQFKTINAEGANTSFQIHLKTAPKDFCDIYNAAQLLVGPCLAISSNSPLFLEHRLWEETRIPLFKQAVETRTPEEKKQGLMSRTGMGKCWLEDSAYELFYQSVHDFDPLLPECHEEASLQAIKQGETPKLSALRLHHGSTWHWNRAIYDPVDNGHLRIEMRCLPSGPSVIDMAANAAFLVGAAVGLAPSMKNITATMPPKLCKYNCYRAAEVGLDAELFWPNKTGQELSQLSALNVVQELLPIAAAGLAQLGVEAAEITKHLDVISQRCDARMTGARWQLGRLQQLEQDLERTEALRTLLREYIQHSHQNLPVHEWQL